MGFKRRPSTKLLEEARGVLVEGFELDGPGFREPSGAYVSTAGTPIFAAGQLGRERAVETAAQIHRWLSERGPTDGDGSLQLVMNQDLRVHPWADNHFVFGVVIREAFGLDGDHAIGLGRRELDDRLRRARAALDHQEPTLAALFTALEVTRPRRGLYLCCSGPLSGSRLVIGRWRADGTAADPDVWFRVSGRDKPALWLSSLGASQDHAVGGVYGLEVASTEFGNRPVSITAGILDSAERKLAIDAPRYFVLADYD